MKRQNVLFYIILNLLTLIWESNLSTTVIFNFLQRATPKKPVRSNAKKIIVEDEQKQYNQIRLSSAFMQVLSMVSDDTKTYQFIVKVLMVVSAFFALNFQDRS